jgi:hypothetical protein
MAEIGFSPGRAWVKAGWAVARLLADMLIVSPDEREIKDVLHEAIDVNSLNFDFVEEPTASRVKKILEDVIADTIQESERLGLKWKEGLDQSRQEQYKQALEELRDLMR